MIQKDIAIIGAGPSGLFAVFQAGMLGMSSCVIDSLDEIGGQCSALYPEKPIYDIPAYPQIDAGDLIAQLSMQSSRFNPEYYLSQQVIKLRQEGENFVLTTSKNIIINCKAVIIAAGSGSFGPKKPPIEGIENFEDKSIFYSIKTKEIFENKKVVIAGGGDSAVDWAISLAKITSKLYLIHRRDKFKAAPESLNLLKALATSGEIELVIGYQLESLTGNAGKLDSVIVKDLNGNHKELQANYLLPFFGLSQDLGPIANCGLNLKSHHIDVNYPYFQTNIPGIYAVGDVASYPGKLKLILTGFAEVASALHHSYSKVFEGKPLHFEYSTTKAV